MKILIAESREFLARQLAGYVHGAGHQPFIASSLPALRRSLRSGLPQVLVLSSDFYAEGYATVLQEIQSLAADYWLPVILVSETLDDLAALPQEVVQVVGSQVERDRFQGCLRTLAPGVERYRQLRIRLDKLAQNGLQDMVTGLPNQERFFDFAERMLRHSKRSQKVISLLRVQIQHPELLGSSACEEERRECLSLIAAAIEESASRPLDMVAVGENDGSFLVLLPETHGGGGMRVLNRLEKRVRGLGLSYPGRKSLIQIQTGMAVSDHFEDTLEELMEAATPGRSLEQIAGVAV